MTYKNVKRHIKKESNNTGLCGTSELGVEFVESADATCKNCVRISQFGHHKVEGTSGHYSQLQKRYERHDPMVFKCNNCARLYSSKKRMMNPEKFPNKCLFCRDKYDLEGYREYLIKKGKLH